MRIERVVCDRCGRDIPKVVRMDFLGLETEECRFGKLNYGFPFDKVDLARYGIEICENCALEISAAMYEWKLQIERSQA